MITMVSSTLDHHGMDRGSYSTVADMFDSPNQGPNRILRGSGDRAALPFRP